ncbi:MAG: phytanoyl-CoA dioxygenase family protein [Pseudomonadota bacterium]
MSTLATPSATPARLDAIERDGYCVIEGALTSAQCARVKAELAPYLQREKMGRNDFEGEHSERVYALLAKAPVIAELIEHVAILPLLDALLAPNYLLSAALAINVHPGETPQPFHIDDGAGSRMLPKPRPAYGVSTIWAIDDFTADNGATEVAPGSHRWAEGREPRADEVVPVIMPAGSVLVFAGSLVHRGGANRSNGSRLAITPQYCMPWLRQIENMVLAVPPELAARYSATIQGMLGYSVIDPGFTGYVDGMHPRRLINPAYRGRKRRADLPS